jgi:hypothetical protein
METIMSPYRFATIVPVLILFSAITWAETMSLPLWDDAWIRAGQPDKNYGDYNTMRINISGGQQTLIRFDASAISGQPISRAILKLYVASITNVGDISIYAITSSWSETTVTWNLRPPTEAYAAAMAEISGLDAALPVVSVDVTDVVQRWAGGSLPDAGLLIKTSEITRAYFVTKEGAELGGAAAELEVRTGPPASMVDRISVLDGYRVLGDPPHSTFWQTDIEIDQTRLSAAKSAHIGMYTIHNTLGRLVINGEVVQLPYVELTNQYGRWRPELGQTLISIPLGYLRSGTNTIRVESGIGNWTTENVYDDFEFGDIEVILSRR